MEKIDLSNFVKSNLLARLYCILKNNSHLIENISEHTNESFLAEVKKIVTENFIYPKKKESFIIDHFALFLLGDENNQFSKLSKL